MPVILLCLAELIFWFKGNSKALYGIDWGAFKMVDLYQFIHKLPMPICLVEANRNRRCLEGRRNLGVV